MPINASNCKLIADKSLQKAAFWILPKATLPMGKLMQTWFRLFLQVKRIYQKEVHIPAHQTETRIYQIIRHIVRVPDYFVRTRLAENHIAYQNTFGHIVENASADEKNTGQRKSDPVKVIQYCGNKADNYNKISEIAPVDERMPVAYLAVCLCIRLGHRLFFC